MSVALLMLFEMKLTESDFDFDVEDKGYDELD